jgi:predicted lipoprotein with Yx(FWY)xxD motif
MKRGAGIVAVAAAVALTAGACIGPGLTAPAAAARGGFTLAVESTNNGPILVDGTGRTLYAFAADFGTSSSCSAACLKVWPVLAATGRPTTGPGLFADLAGTAKQADGRTVVTYNGRPLYYFTGDAAPGQINGQDVTEFGDKWYVISPDGWEVMAPGITAAARTASPGASPR